MVAGPAPQLPEPAAAVFSVIARHRSIRRFRSDPVPEEHLKAILEAGRRAPTDATLHLWTAILVRSPETRRRISELTRQPHVAEAPVLLVFVADLYRVERLLRHRGEEMGDVDLALLLFAAVDAALAAENMAVTAEALGYGTCFIGGVFSVASEVARLLSLPPRTLPLFDLLIGVPAEDPPLRPRLPLEMLVHGERYRDYTAEQLEEAYRVMAPIARGDWLRVLKRYAGRGGVFEQRNRQLPGLLRERGFRLPG